MLTKKLRRSALVLGILLSVTQSYADQTSQSSLSPPFPPAPVLHGGPSIIQLSTVYANDARGNIDFHKIRYSFQVTDSLDLEKKLSPTTVTTLRSLPMNRMSAFSHSTDVKINEEVLKAAGINLSETLFIKQTGDPKTIIFTFKNATNLRIDWGEGYKEKKHASVSVEIPTERSAEEGFAVGFVGKDNPFKENAMIPLVWNKANKSSAAEKASTYIRSLSKVPQPNFTQLEATSFGSFKLFYLASSITVSGDKSEQAFGYFLEGTVSSFWISGLPFGGEGYFAEPKDMVSGDILKGYDQVLILGTQGSYMCGSIYAFDNSQPNTVKTKELDCLKSMD